MAPSSLRELLKGNLLVFTLGDMIRMLSVFITFPYFSLYVKALGGSMITIGFINSLRPLLALFIYPVAGYLSDRRSRVNIIAATSYVTAGLWLLFLFAPDWRWLAVGNLLLGLQTFYFPAANSLMADSLPPGSRGLGYSLWRALPATLGVASPYIGGYLITVWGVTRAMRFLYGLTIAASLIIATMNLRYLKETPRDPPQERGIDLRGVLVGSYRKMIGVVRGLPVNLKAYAVMLASGFLFNGAASSYWVIYGTEAMGLTELQWGTLLLAAALVNVVLLVPAGLLTDRFGAERIMILSLVVVAVPVLLFPYSTSYTWTLLLFALMTLANTFLMAAAPAYMATASPPEVRGRVMAALGMGFLFVDTRGGSTGGGPGMGALLTVPSIVGSMLGGIMYDIDPKLIWLLLGGSMIINALLAFVYLRRGGAAT